MKQELLNLRKQMKDNKIDAYLIMTDDFHGSEYVGDYFKCRKYISGFSGSAGTLLVLEKEAGLWTDGRYFLQAERELENTGITLFCSGEPGVPSIEEYLERHMEKGQTLGFDGRCVMADYAARLNEIVQKKGIQICSDRDLVGEIWKDRPALSSEPVWELDSMYAGMTRQKKISCIREKMKENSADWFLLASLEDIAWTLNIRGNDVECTPVMLSYLLMSEEQIIWYVQKKCVSNEICSSLEKEGITLREYDEIFSDIRNLPAGDSILYDSTHVNAALYTCIPSGVKKIDKQNPTLLLKAIKNPVEVENERIAHIRDGVAVTRFIYWLKTQVGKETITECSAAGHLEMLRKEQEDYVGPSFPPIIAYKEHGAIVHYSADKDSDVPLMPEGYVLADTGGHYLQGTTDITRTIALGTLTHEEKELYTTVLRGHIHLSMARFLHGCTGVSLDGLARTPLWEKGYDYNHGTGHGVGYLLSVHEGPNSFRYRPAVKRGNDCVFEEGMITSNEPGVYLAGKFGIRLENMIVCVKDTENGYGRFLKFEPLTMVPFDLDAILPEQMTQKEIRWLNAYHKQVYDTIAPYLNESEKVWLKTATREIGD
ncbi:MAG: aminopeptidase P family protein [Lachnospiraceae bacterium]|nr:aminopeptidase P family protein [Lachnospiraceae bacterium]